MIPMKLGQVAAAVGVPCSPEDENVAVHRVVTDSRMVATGDLFIAIRGERFDGHEFLAQAAERGAVGCICRRTQRDARGLVRVDVDDTIEALGRLAAYYRREVMPGGAKFIAVTGSNGKTTTKRMIDHVLAGALPGRCSPRSFNNAIGVPLTILSGEGGDRYMIAEIGTNSPGEVAALAAMVSPDVGVITSIGEAHLEGLGDLVAIAAEKASLLDHVRSDGVAVVNADSPRIIPHLKRTGPPRVTTFGRRPDADMRVAPLRAELSRTTFELDGRHVVELSFPGMHHAYNAAAAFVVGRWFGLAPREILERLRSFEPPEGRTRPVVIGDITVVDDTYNANPASMGGAIDTLRCVSTGRRMLVMGDMLELGAATATLHRRVLADALDAGIEVVVTVGPAFAGAADANADRGRIIRCEDAESAGDVVLSLCAPGDTVWIKGSRALRLDRVVERLLASDSGNRPVARDGTVPAAVA